MIQQRPHTHAVSELACSIHSDITELRPQRHLHVCIVSRRAKISKVVTRNRGDDSTASGVTVFLIHGVGGSIDVWRSQFDSLLVPAVAKIVAVDLIGHGQSSAPRHHEAYQFEAIALDVTALFTQFRSMNNIIIGHSYGCRFAAVLACEYPFHVSKLVLISAGAPLPLSPRPGCLQLPDCCLTCLRPVLISTFMRRLFHHNARRLSASVSIPPGYVVKNMLMGQRWSKGDEHFFAAIDVETLLIHGRHDRLISPAHTQLMHETIPRSQLRMIEDAGHLVMIERPAQVNKCLQDFLFSLQPASELAKK